jgi:hypothetical protein
MGRLRKLGAGAAFTLSLLGMAAAGVAHAEIFYIGEAELRHAEEDAKAISYPCERQLKTNVVASACVRYHEAVRYALELSRRKRFWCRDLASREETFNDVPGSCRRPRQPDMRLRQLLALEHQKLPVSWRRFNEDIKRLQQ